MPNAKELAAGAAQLRSMAAAVKPEAAELFRDSLNLAVYHLNSAAKIIQTVAEVKAGQEGIEL
jgi:hypothetical protein